MATHRFQPTRYYNTIGSHEPALHVADGDTVIAATADAGGFDASGARTAPPGNPQSGPFYVEGAEPGDTLVVDLHRLTTTRDWGFTATIISENVVDPEHVRDLPPQATVIWRIDRESGTVSLMDPPEGIMDGARRVTAPPDNLRDRTFPLAPMIGCFGVAPAHGQAISTATSPDTAATWTIAASRRASPSTSRSSCRARSSTWATATRCKGTARSSAPGSRPRSRWSSRVTVRKGKQIGWPRGENDGLHLHRRQRPAARPGAAARDDRDARLRGRLRPRRPLRQHPVGQTVEYDLGNIFDPAYTMVCKMAKRWLGENG